MKSCTSALNTSIKKEAYGFTSIIDTSNAILNFQKFAENYNVNKKQNDPADSSGLIFSTDTEIL
jgi:hypothetical protein